MTEKPDIHAARQAAEGIIADEDLHSRTAVGQARHVLALADALEQAKIREQAVLAEMDIPTTPETLVENIRSLVQKMRVEWTRASAWHAHWKDVSEKLEQCQAREAALREALERIGNEATNMTQAIAIAHKAFTATPAVPEWVTAVRRTLLNILGAYDDRLLDRQTVPYLADDIPLMARQALAIMPKETTK